MKRIVLALAFLLVACSMRAQNLESIFKLYGDAYGGYDRIRNIKTIVEEVVVESGTKKMTVTHYISYPNKHRIEVVLDGKRELYVLNGNRGQSLVNDWLMDIDTAHIEDFKTSMRKHALIFDREQFNPKRSDRKITYEGLDTVGGIEAYKVKMADDTQTDRFLYIDKKSNRAIKTVSRQFIKFNVFKEVEIIQDSISKYGNIFAPSLITAKAKGKTVLVQRLAKLEIDTPLPDSLFVIEEKKK